MNVLPIKRLSRLTIGACLLTFLSAQTQAPTALSPTSQAASSIRVSFVSGQANVKLNQAINPVSQIQTGVHGRVQLHFHDGSAIRIGPHSELVVLENNPQNNRSLLQLKKGRAYSQIKSSPNKQLLIKGKHSIAAVLGTTWNIDVNPSLTSTTVFEGEVGIHRPFKSSENQSLWEQLPPPSSPPGGPLREIPSPVYEVPAPVHLVPGPHEISYNQWVSLVSNQQIQMGDDGKARIQEINLDTLISNDEWIKWNQLMDQANVREQGEIK